MGLQNARNQSLSLAWLREDGDKDSFQSELDARREIATDEWAATFEHRIIHNELRTVCTRASVHRDMAIQVSIEKPVDGPWTSFNILDEGRIDARFDDIDSVKLESGHINFHTIKNWTADYRMAANTTIRHFSVSLSDSTLSKMMGDDIPDELLPLVAPDSMDSAIFHLKCPVEVRRIARSLIASPLQGRLREIEIEGAIIQIFAYIGYYLGREPVDQAASSTERGLVRSVRERLISEIADPPTLQQLADSHNISTRRLNELFKQTHDMTVVEFLRRERMEQARALIENEKVVLKQIAHRVGYNHVSNFITAFKEHFGVTPGAYKNE